ncbi:MAG TPA: hypothetical protein PLU93_07385 [Treponemataceae bacterium]|nr:hypothetical protein [Treponemataceae bacterium]
MKKETVVCALALAPLVPAMSRLSYALVLGSAFFILLLVGILSAKAISRIGLRESHPAILLAALTATASLFVLALRALYPLLAVSLSFFVHILAVSGLVVFSVSSDDTDRAASIALYAIPFFLVFAAAREFLSFGMLTVPAPSGLVAIVSVPAIAEYGMPFWATAGGALFLAGAFVWIAKRARRMASLYSRRA